MKNKKRMKEKENFSSLMQDKARESRLVGKNRSHNVLISSVTNINDGGVVDSRASEQINKFGWVDNKSISFLLLFLIFSFIFMVIGINFVSATTDNSKNLNTKKSITLY